MVENDALTDTKIDPRELVAGQRVRYKLGQICVLKERKEDDTGWWLDDGQGGLADWVWAEQPCTWSLVPSTDDEVQHLQKAYNGLCGVLASLGDAGWARSTIGSEIEIIRKQLAKVAFDDQP